MTEPTGTSSPSWATKPARTPLARASSSSVALSVWISAITSPALTASPSALSQRTSWPVCWAMPSAGIITSVAIGWFSLLAGKPRRVNPRLRA